MMLPQCVNNVLLKCAIKRLSFRYSALFINGERATESFVYLSPYIDYNEKIQNKTQLQKDLTRRNNKLDWDKIESVWKVFNELQQKKKNLETKKQEVNLELSKLLKSDPDSDATKKLKIHSDLLKENIKKLKVPLWSAEENAVIAVLKLPNTLHNLTPDNCEHLYTHLTKPNNKKNHLSLGNDLKLINFKKNENYYLTNEAALLELGAKFYFSEQLKNKKYIQFSNPDFVKSLIVEGCGEDYNDTNKTFILHNDEAEKTNVSSHLHLTGGGSLQSFMAYHAKNTIFSKTLPLKYFCMGRQYIPPPSDEDSLFHVSQSSVVQIFCAARDSNEMNSLFNEQIEIIKEIYCQFGYHFRLTLNPPDKLLSWESLRLSLEMFSTSLNTYVEVGNLSMSGDYISKRLMFTYSDKKEHKFPHILSGTILNIPKFLGCVLEQDREFSVPKQFDIKSWSSLENLLTNSIKQ